MKEYGIDDYGDTKTMGIGAMTDARWADFFKMASGQGLYPADLDYKKAYSLRFVNQGHALEAAH
jgi:NitT/TauT family transport system substrate-binding protein